MHAVCIRNMILVKERNERCSSGDSCVCFARMLSSPLWCLLFILIRISASCDLCVVLKVLGSVQMTHTLSQPETCSVLPQCHSQLNGHCSPLSLSLVSIKSRCDSSSGFTERLSTPHCFHSRPRFFSQVFSSFNEGRFYLSHLLWVWSKKCTTYSGQKLPTGDWHGKQPITVWFGFLYWIGTGGSDKIKTAVTFCTRVENGSRAGCLGNRLYRRSCMTLVRISVVKSTG